ENNDVEAEYDRLRDLARQEARKRGDCFERSRQAYENGDGAEAKRLSNEGKKHGANMERYNKQASEYIFRENNNPERVAEDTIDLHGQFVEEAEDILEARIRDAQARARGTCTAGGVQKIKPRVEQVCRELGLDYATEANDGRIFVDLTGAKVGAPPPLPPQPGVGTAAVVTGPVTVATNLTTILVMARPTTGVASISSTHRSSNSNITTTTAAARTTISLIPCCIVM
ncbi:hypothetical protein MCOR02_012407, partial [Pyricularia oryzae]